MISEPPADTMPGEQSVVDSGSLVVAADPAIAKALERSLSARGWQIIREDLPETAGRPCTSLLPPDEDWIENWARAICSTLGSAHSPALLVFAHPGAGMRRRSYGFLLTERVWSEQTAPTVIAVLDPSAAAREGTRRVRETGGVPCLLTCELSGSMRSSLKAPAPVLWDCLGGLDELETALARARECFGANADTISRQLRNQLQAEREERDRRRRERVRTALSEIRRLVLADLLSLLAVEPAAGSSEWSQALRRLAGRFFRVVEAGREPWGEFPQVLDESPAPFRMAYRSLATHLGLLPPAFTGELRSNPFRLDPAHPLWQPETDGTVRPSLPGGCDFREWGASLDASLLSLIHSVAGCEDTRSDQEPEFCTGGESLAQDASPVQ